MEIELTSPNSKTFNWIQNNVQEEENEDILKTVAMKYQYDTTSIIYKKN